MDGRYQTDMAQTEKKHIDIFLQLQDPISQCEYLLMLGMKKPALDSLREERYRIGGCRTAIWIRADNQGEPFILPVTVIPCLCGGGGGYEKWVWGDMGKKPV
ncbi:MAG: SufE family protein, partial [Clostridia bacterium]|nr:SufE family protein [Clostridia bacterium]